MNIAAQIQIVKSVLVLKHGDGSHDESDHGNRTGSGKSKLWEVAALASSREHKLEDEYKALVRRAKGDGILSHPKINELREAWQNARAERKRIEADARKEDRAAGLTHRRGQA